jgi:hypothetical protein
MSIPLYEQYKQLMTLPAFADFRHELDRTVQQMKEEYWTKKPEERAELETKIEHYEEFLGGINKILLDKQKKFKEE